MINRIMITEVEAEEREEAEVEAEAEAITLIIRVSFLKRKIRLQREIRLCQNSQQILSQKTSRSLCCGANRRQIQRKPH